jgi:hypothetical protein
MVYVIQVSCEQDQDGTVLHPEKLNDLYCSPNIHMIRSRKRRLAGHVVHMGEMRGAYRILVRKPQGQIQTQT